MITHADGTQTAYAHLSRTYVHEGMRVRADIDWPIGRQGNTGKSNGSHLHFEVIKDGVRVNPLKYLVEP